MTESDDQKEPSSVGTTNDLPIRQSLVKTAVSFLLNPEVKNKPDGNKAAFLKKKGLTDVEISLAFDQAKCDPRYTSDIPQVDNRKNHFELPPVAHIATPYPFWSKLSSVSSSLIVLGVALYGLHRFYKLYIEPWLFGKESEESRLGQMEQQLLEVNRSLSQLKKNVSTMEQTMNSKMQQFDRFFQNEVNEYLPTPLLLKDLKDEVGAIKSLLLSRHQFPAVPKFNPTIPIWQLPTAEDEDAEIEHNKKSAATESIENMKNITNGTDINGHVNGSSTNEIIDASPAVLKDNPTLSDLDSHSSAGESVETEKDQKDDAHQPNEVSSAEYSSTKGLEAVENMANGTSGDHDRVH